MEAPVPQLKDHLPELHELVSTLARQIAAGELQGGDALVARFREFYSDERMRAIERVAPGWQDMAAQADRATLHHISHALIALQLLPEFREAPQSLRSALEWTVLFHDLGKRVISGRRDALHAFRSAAMAARALPQLGFPCAAEYLALIEPWTRLVLGAAVAAADGKGPIPDNRALPEILRGTEQLFGSGSAASLIVQAVLLHQSLNVVPEWPNPGSLTAAELSRCIRPALLPLLEAMMLVDSDAWQLFDPATRAQFRNATLGVFADLRRRVDGRVVVAHSRRFRLTE
jgi:hypothetical protein